MQEYLKSTASNQQLYGMLCNRGLVWQDTGRLSGGAVVLAMLDLAKAADFR